MSAPEVWFLEPDFHGDDYAAAGDDLRDLADLDPKGPQPKQEDLA